MALQRDFEGLAQYLGLYEGGQLKLDLFRQVVPSFDIEDFIAPTQIQAANVVVNATGTFYPVGAACPAGKRRIVDSLHIRSTAPLGAGETLRIDPSFTSEGGLNAGGLANGMPALVTTHWVDFGVFFQPKWIMNEGDQIGWFTRELSVVNQTMRVAYRYHEISV